MCQQRGLLRRCQRVDNRIQTAVHHGVDIEILYVALQTVIGHTTLREIVGADTLAAVATADLTAALRRTQLLPPAATKTGKSPKLGIYIFAAALLATCILLLLVLQKKL